MEQASVESQTFTDATCDKLTHLVLSVASLGVENQCPQWMVDEFEDVLRDDPAVRRWVVQVGGGTGFDSPLELARHLTRDASWYATDTGSSRADAAVACARPARAVTPAGQHIRATDSTGTRAAAERLRDTAFLVLRLRALDVQFADELAAQKRQALYNFAYGLSHELNNPLANIATRAGVLAQDELNPQRSQLLESIVDNAMRGCEMLGDLMMLARPPTITPAATSIGELVESVSSRARGWSLPRSVGIDVKHDFDEPLQIDPQAIQEALWAIVRNGIEAMPDGGKLTIRTRIREPKPNVRGAASRACLIEITDQGQGLTEEALENCFDPYYSGREAGRGLGLGLAKAQRLIQLHGGRLTIANRCNGGCSVRIELPAIGRIASAPRVKKLQDTSEEYKTMSNAAIASLIDSGTKLYLDSIDPDLVKRNLEWGAVGATSNPIIVTDLIKSGRFDDQLEELHKSGNSDEEIAWELTDQLVRQAQEAFLPIWRKTHGNAGWVSFELDPLIEDPERNLPHAERVERYIALGRRWSAGHDNRMIKVPATPAGLESVQTLAADGVTLNVTLVFTMDQYVQARDGVWAGAQQRTALDDFKSVYSIFVSRVDQYTAKHLPQLSDSAQGLVGIVNAKRMWLANQAFWKSHSTPLAQEIIFASTGTKNPSDPPTKYVAALAGSDIQTNPPATNEAVAESDLRFTSQVAELPPQEVLDEIDGKLDVADMHEVLMREGIDKFATPQKKLIELIASKKSALA